MFSWKRICAEVTAKVAEFESEDQKLSGLMIRLHRNGLKVPSVVDQNPKGKSTPLDETDLFNFMAISNQRVTSTSRIALLPVRTIP